jgi:hypothetical protein
LSGNGRFSLTMGPSKFIKEGETEAHIEPKLFTVGPAA